MDEDGKKIRDKLLKKPRKTPKYRDLGVKLAMERRLLEKGYAKDDLYPVWSSILHTQVGSVLMDVAVRRNISRRRTDGPARAGRSSSSLHLPWRNT